ncbi:MAG: adenosine deaminase [Chloroflexota bacterium]
MAVKQAPRPLSFYQALPKVELHRHLEGSLRVKTLMETAAAYNIPTNGIAALRSLVQVGDHDPYTYQNILSKFAVLRQFYRSPEIIERITREAIEDAAQDNVRYLELRFTPVALSRAGNFPLAEVIDRVIAGAQAGQDAWGLTTRLIVSVNRHESTGLAEKVAHLAADRIDKHIVGLDLAGNEAEFSAKPFVGIFREARQSGLKITVHAGEWDGAANVVEAIEELSAMRIGHGVRVLEDQRAVALALERAIPFEVCLTSNYHSGVVASLDAHPLRHLLDLGLNISLNADDPSISNITLGDEFYLASERLGLPLSVLGNCIAAGARAAFLPKKEKTALLASIQTEFSSWINVG